MDEGQGQGLWSSLCSIVPPPLHLRNQGTRGWLGRKKGCPAPQRSIFLHQASVPRCKWCTNCPEGACIGRNGSCTSENDCRINQREVFWAGNCSEAACGAADCEQCTREGKCMWTRQFKRTGEP